MVAPGRSADAVLFSCRGRGRVAVLAVSRRAVWPRDRARGGPGGAATMVHARAVRMKARYAEIGVTSNFSFLRGASHPQEYVHRAADYGLPAVGIADRNPLAGVVGAYAE